MDWEERQDTKKSERKRFGDGAIHPFYSPLAPPPCGIKTRFWIIEKIEKWKAINLGATYDERRADLTLWLEYFARGFKQEIDEVKNNILPLSSRKMSRKIKSQIYLTPEQLKIIDFLDQIGRITVKDVEGILSCPKRTAQLYLQKLKKTKTIKATGKGKTTAYIANQ